MSERAELFVNLDWTEFENSGQSMVVLGLQTTHDRSTPLVSKAIRRSALGDKRNENEDHLLLLFAAEVPGDVRVTVVADRGFGDSKLYRLHGEIGFDNLIRSRGVIAVESAEGEVRKGRDWVGASGRITVLKEAKVTVRREPVPVMICVRDHVMKDAVNSDVELALPYF